MANVDSEFRAYGFIEKSLADMGWDVRNPLKYAAGQVFTQNEALKDSTLGALLKGKKPENVVKINTNTYWTIEAKKEHAKIDVAVKEAQAYAELINESTEAKAFFATGVAGTDDNTFIVETYYLEGDVWKRVSINSINLTGFITPAQISAIMQAGSAGILNEVIEEKVFLDTANQINEILHKGAINKKNRARVISSLLLALVSDEYMRISDDPTTLIADINTRVKSLLGEYGKENFAQEIAIHLPTSKDNHVKNRRALVESLQILKNINIKSALNSGTDLLGQFYEIFLKYANDSKEIGIVLTPRHITRFAAECIDVNENDYVYDPTCGTGGFLVSSFDKVKGDSPSAVDMFKKSHVYGVDQDPEVIGLAIVNMIFRGDGSSNLFEGNTFDNYFLEIDGEQRRIKRDEHKQLMEDGRYIKPFITKVLMNPPFALDEKEFEFVDHALQQTREGGLLFAVLPTSVMAANTNREIQWRKELLKRHSLKVVVKLSEDLFLPNAHKGTYAVIIKAWEPHGNKDVLWALMDDGFVMKKAKRLPSTNVPSNLDLITREVKNFVLHNKTPQEVESVLSFSEINFEDEILDCSPEAYLPYQYHQNIDISKTSLSLADSLIKRKRVSDLKLEDINFELFAIDDLLEKIVRGDCAPINQLSEGDTPIISTTEVNNGIDGYYLSGTATKFSDSITIPANGSKYQAFYHPYEFYAVPDVLVCEVKKEYSDLETKLYLCSIFNQSSWRFSYFRKCNEYKLKKDVRIPLPVKNGKIDLEFMKKKVHETMGFELINKLVLLEDAEL